VVGSDVREVVAERGMGDGRQHGDAVALALGLADAELPDGEVDVLEPEAEAFEEAEATAVQKERDQTRVPCVAASTRATSSRVSTTGGRRDA
jgi:hypothetical protein